MFSAVQRSVNGTQHFVSLQFAIRSSNFYVIDSVRVQCSYNVCWYSQVSVIVLPTVYNTYW